MKERETERGREGGRLRGKVIILKIHEVTREGQRQKIREREEREEKGGMREGGWRIYRAMIGIKV